MELLEYDTLMRALRQKRQQLCLQQKEVAHRADISKSHLNRMERNYTNANYRTVYKVWKTINKAETEERETATDLMNQPIAWAHPDDTHRDVRESMWEGEFSQLPVREESECVGRITEGILAENDDHDRSIRELIGPPLLDVPHDTGREAIKELLMDDNPALLVTKEDEFVGIITKADLI